MYIFIVLCVRCGVVTRKLFKMLFNFFTGFMTQTLRVTPVVVLVPITSLKTKWDCVTNWTTASIYIGQLLVEVTHVLHHIQCIN